MNHVCVIVKSTLRMLYYAQADRRARMEAEKVPVAIP